MTDIPITREQWKRALDELPEGGKIPAFYFAHGQPALIWPPGVPSRGGRFDDIMDAQGPKSSLANFLRDFGPVLLKKYKPCGIVVFSAHWETVGERLVSDYGEENPLLMDYYNFHPDLYKVEFKSRGDTDLSNQVVGLFSKFGIKARTTPASEKRGRDGRGFQGPGLDHGVFVPFKLMFGDEFLDIPIVQVSIDESLDPESNWKIGKAVDALRSDGVLILSGGLTIHTFQDFTAFTEKTAGENYKQFSKDIIAAAQEQSPSARRSALLALTSHPTFRLAHPREEHFVPIYVAAGAGEEGGSKVLAGFHNGLTFAFGL